MFVDKLEVHGVDEQALYDLWSKLNAMPEVSWQEKETTAFLMNYFEQEGFTPQPFTKMPGFYVEIGEGKPKIGLRADMDAVMQHIDGKLQANHSCGHDAHMTIVTGTMLQLKKKMKCLQGTIRAIFQPAEELGNGSLKVIETGIVDDLDFLFGVHVRPKNELVYPTCAAGIQHGACVFLNATIIGDDHHGARPHEGINAIEVGYAIFQQLQQIHIAPDIPSSIKMTRFQAGSEAVNVIPGSATFSLDIRAQTNDALNQIKERIKQVMETFMKLYDIKIEFTFIDEVPAAVINEEAENVLFEAIVDNLGTEHAKRKVVTAGSDDFHFYTLLRPNIKATMLALGADVVPGLHAPNMTFNKAALNNGVKILTSACEKILARHRKTRYNSNFRGNNGTFSDKKRWTY